jgi:C-terminal processing protease CtpA/Prc
MFGLPNAIYATSDNRTFDVMGIPPDIRVPVFNDAEIATGADPALEAAKRILSTKQ